MKEFAMYDPIKKIEELRGSIGVFAYFRSSSNDIGLNTKPNLFNLINKRTKNQQKEVDILLNKLNKLGINQSNLFKKRSYKRKKYDRKIDKLFAKIRKYPSNNSVFWREIGEIKLDGENLELGHEILKKIVRKYIKIN